MRRHTTAHRRQHVRIEEVREHGVSDTGEPALARAQAGERHRLADYTVGEKIDHVDGATVEEVIANATARYGQNFANLLPTCRIWVNGEAVPTSTPVSDKDEVAVLPPVSGGCQ